MDDLTRFDATPRPRREPDPLPALAATAFALDALDHLGASTGGDDPWTTADHTEPDHEDCHDDEGFDGWF